MHLKLVRARRFEGMLFLGKGDIFRGAGKKTEQRGQPIKNNDDESEKEFLLRRRSLGLIGALHTLQLKDKN